MQGKAMQCKGREGKKSRVIKVDVDLDLEVGVEAMTMRGIVDQPNQPAHYTNQLQGSNIQHSGF